MLNPPLSTFLKLTRKNQFKTNLIRRANSANAVFGLEVFFHSFEPFKKFKMFRNTSKLDELQRKTLLLHLFTEMSNK
jgi:hypothetical protein